MITYCFLASNIAGPVGGAIGSILVLIIVSIVCCVTVVVIRKKRKRQNVRSYNTQQFELQTIGSLDTTETMTKTGLSRPLPKLPNSTLNTIPQTQDYYSFHVTQPKLYPVPNCRSLPHYNENSNKVGPHEVQIPVLNPHLAPYQQQQQATYQHQPGHHLLQQPVVNIRKPNQHRDPNTSAALTSFATLPAHNPIVQESRQQGSNLFNWEEPSDVETTFDNPAYGFLGATIEKSDFENIEGIYDDIK